MDFLTLKFYVGSQNNFDDNQNINLIFFHFIRFILRLPIRLTMFILRIEISIVKNQVTHPDTFQFRNKISYHFIFRNRMPWTPVTQNFQPKFRKPGLMFVLNFNLVFFPVESQSPVLLPAAARFFVLRKGEVDPQALVFLNRLKKWAVFPLRRK